MASVHEHFPIHERSGEGLVTVRLQQARDPGLLQEEIRFLRKTMSLDRDAPDLEPAEIPHQLQECRVDAGPAQAGRAAHGGIEDGDHSAQCGIRSGVRDGQGSTRHLMFPQRVRWVDSGHPPKQIKSAYKDHSR